MVGTPREQQVMDAWKAGLSIGQIAAQLDLSYSYVKNRVCDATSNGPNRQYIAAMKRSSDMLRDRVLAARVAL